GHIILLNPVSSLYYQETKRKALAALRAYPGGLQVGGGIRPERAGEFMGAGASHVIVTYYVFRVGALCWENLENMIRSVGRERMVLDLSCRKKDGVYWIVTDRWQKFARVEVNRRTLDRLSGYCDEFLVHAVDVEGKASGIETELAALLAGCENIPITYACGVGSFRDLENLREAGKNRLDVTVGSALDLFG